MSDKPAFPYVEFKHVKKKQDHDEKMKTLVKSEEVEACFMRVDGCHGQPESVLRKTQEGKVLVGYGNLEKPKYKALKRFLDGQLGTSTDPRLKEVDPALKKLEAKKNESTKTS